MKLFKNNFDGLTGTYVCMKPSSEGIDALHQNLKLDDLPNGPDKDLHLTIMYSKEHVAHTIPDLHDNEHVALATGIEHWSGHDGDGYLVLKMICNPAKQLHEGFKDVGCKHSFDDYTPHVTLKTGLQKDEVGLWIDQHKDMKPFLVKFDQLHIENIK